MKRRHLTLDHYKANSFQHFLLLCSGANLHLLKKTPGDWNKYAGIGGIVLFTAIFAALSAGYAMYTIFDEVFITIAFALLWGTMIFNLDRYIVSSIKKTGTWGKQILMSLPRLVLAAFLGIIISKPLELKIFEKEINKQLNTIIQRNKKELQSQMNTRILQQTKPFDEEQKKIESQLLTYQKAYDSAAVDLEREILGKNTGLTSGKVGFGSNAKRKQELKDLRLKDLENFKKSIAPRANYLHKEISKVYDNLEKERKSTETFEDKYNGFAARLQALDELGENSSIIATAALFIMGLFICLEIAPVLVKLISSVGPYDYLLEKYENDFELYSKEKITKNTLDSENRIEIHKKDLNR